jgi:hypothetical protein
VNSLFCGGHLCGQMVQAGLQLQQAQIYVVHADKAIKILARLIEHVYISGIKTYLSPSPSKQNHYFISPPRLLNFRS